MREGRENNKTEGTVIQYFFDVSMDDGLSIMLRSVSKQADDEGKGGAPLKTQSDSIQTQ